MWNKTKYLHIYLRIYLKMTYSQMIKAQIPTRSPKLNIDKSAQFLYGWPFRNNR